MYFFWEINIIKFHAKLTIKFFRILQSFLVVYSADDITQKMGFAVISDRLNFDSDTFHEKLEFPSRIFFNETSTKLYRNLIESETTEKKFLNLFLNISPESAHKKDVKRVRCLSQFLSSTKNIKFTRKHHNVGSYSHETPHFGRASWSFRLELQETKD